MTGKTLGRYSSVRAALVALPVWAVACGPAPLPDTTLFDSPDCTDDDSLTLDGLRPAVPVDYMELRQRVPASEPKILSNTGQECYMVTSGSKCQDALAAAETAPGFHPCSNTDCGHSLATTLGDTVSAYPDTKSLLGFLGVIDTPMDAVMMVYAQGYDVSCTDKSVGGVRAALNGDGYEVLASLISPSCNPTKITGYQFHVTRGGALTYFSSWPVSVVPGMLPCP